VYEDVFAVVFAVAVAVVVVAKRQTVWFSIPAITKQSLFMRVYYISDIE
jgi:hypothetical protein